MSPVSRGISFHESLFYSLYRLVDAAAIVLAVRFALAQTSGAGLPEWLAISAGTIMSITSCPKSAGFYRSWRGTRLRVKFRCVLLTWAYTVAVVLGVRSCDAA